MTDEEMYAIDDEVADAEARAVAEHLPDSLAARDALRVIYERTGSRSYTIGIAQRVVLLVTYWALDVAAPQLTIPPAMSSLIDFVVGTRTMLDGES